MSIFERRCFLSLFVALQVMFEVEGLEPPSEVKSKACTGPQFAVPFKPCLKENLQGLKREPNRWKIIDLDMLVFLQKQTKENWVSYQTCHQRGELRTCSHRSKLMRQQRVIGSSLAGCGRAGFGRIWCLLLQESSQGKFRPTVHSQVWSLAHFDYKGFFTRDIFQHKKHDPAACPSSRQKRQNREVILFRSSAQIHHLLAQ